MNKVFCFGELMLRFSPHLEGKWLKDSVMPVYAGGAELNVSIALARWNQPVMYCTALPENYLSHEILNSLQQKNIDVSAVIFSGTRIGTYYLPQGADLKNTGVIYDRAFSSFAELQPGQIDWDTVLSEVKWFHFSAINPALGKNAAIVCREALEVAAKKNIVISVDLNYRPKLWQYGEAPSAIMPELVQYCKIVMGNVWAAETMLNIPVNIRDKTNKSDCLQQAMATSQAICHKFPRCSQVANTFRFDQHNGILYYATLFNDNELFVSGEKQTDQVIDQVGSGDCFMAGLIYGNMKDQAPQEIIDFAAAAAFNKLFIKGDVTTSSVDEIKNFKS
ncbi:MAG: sugar kinase [Chitinophagaceae bacterium]|nr:sugar kinase [Chitinophagaceae bacterium]